MISSIGYKLNDVSSPCRRGSLVAGDDMVTAVTLAEVQDRSGVAVACISFFCSVAGMLNPDQALENYVQKSY